MNKQIKKQKYFLVILYWGFTLFLFFTCVCTFLIFNGWEVRFKKRRRKWFESKISNFWDSVYLSSHQLIGIIFHACIILSIICWYFYLIFFSFAILSLIAEVHSSNLAKLWKASYDKLKTWISQNLHVDLIEVTYSKRSCSIIRSSSY